MVRAIKIALCIAVVAAVAAYFSGAFQRPSHAMTAAEHVEHIKAMSASGDIHAGHALDEFARGVAQAAPANMKLPADSEGVLARLASFAAQGRVRERHGRRQADADVGRASRRQRQGSRGRRHHGDLRIERLDPRRGRPARGRRLHRRRARHRLGTRQGRRRHVVALDAAGDHAGGIAAARRGNHDEAEGGARVRIEGFAEQRQERERWLLLRRRAELRVRRQRGGVERGGCLLRPGAD